MSEFKPGDMVECVRGNSRHPAFKPLVEGARYTVEAVSLSVGFRHVDGRRLYLPGVRLKEQRSGGVEGFYVANRFRLIKPRATDISIFREVDRKVFVGEGRMTAAQTIRALDNDMREVAILYHLIETCGPGAFTAAEHSSHPPRRRAARHVRELTFYDNANGCGNG